MSDPYIRLWQAVIQQQFADMRNQNHKEDAAILRSQARHWLLEDCRDFTMACELAGLHPEKVRAYAQQMSKM
jgi:hypothetical protein